MRAITTVSAPAALAPGAWNELWRLTHQYYDTDREYAEAELRRHQRLALFRSADDHSLVGMASLDILNTTFRGARVAAIFTSHVLLQEAWRGQHLIQKLGLRMFLETRLRHPLHSIYWFFDTFSYKSYLLMPRNFRDFWPRYDLPTPEFERALIAHLASQVHGPAWRPGRGVAVRSGRKRLRASTAPLAIAPGIDPHMDFYARANPGHAEGDMLVCLCPLTLRNWISVARKALGRLRRASSRRGH